MALKRGRVRQYENGKADGAQDLYPGNSTNIKWHCCSVEKLDRQGLLNQKGCVIWITGLSGSGALSRELHSRGKLTYVFDGDNVRHGLNSDLTFKAEDRAENIRRIGEVAKLFSDAGLICIASLISPYRKDRAACRAFLPEGDFIEVFMDVPIQVCEQRDPKGLYKLVRSGLASDYSPSSSSLSPSSFKLVGCQGKRKSKSVDDAAGFTGIDDPYVPPVNCEIVLKQVKETASPCKLVENVISYLDEKGYLHA